MIKICLLAAVLGLDYLWAVDNCRPLCGVLWVVAPFVLLVFYSKIEKKGF